MADIVWSPNEGNVVPSNEGQMVFDELGAIAISAGSISISGQSSNLEKGYALSCEAGSITLTGSDVTLTVTEYVSGMVWDNQGDPIPVDDGQMVFDELSSYYAYSLTCEAGSISLTGSDATLLETAIIDALSNSFDITGTTASLEKGYALSCEVGSVSITGTAAALVRNKTIDANSTAYALTGIDATLLHTAFVIAETDSIALTGTDATLLAAFAEVVESTSYALTGTDATLLKDSILTCEAGSTSLTGSDADLTYYPNDYLLIDAGSFDITGTDADFGFPTRVLSCEAGSTSITGFDASTLIGYLVGANVVSFNITGTDALFTAARTMPANDNNVAITGINATLARSYIFYDVESGQFLITGSDIGLTYTEVLASGIVILAATANAPYISASASLPEISVS